MRNELALAKELDFKDPLKNFRRKFVNNINEIYLDGNSLGKLPKSSVQNINKAVNFHWGKNLIRSWNDHWLNLIERVSSKLEILFNANKNEITIGESTSVFLHQILTALINSNKYQKHLISDNLNFPSDIYIMNRISEINKSVRLTIIKYNSDIEADLKKLKNKIKSNPGIICLSLVTYKSSWIYPMKEINDWALMHKSIIVWDLSHASGVIDLNFKNSQTLIAVGCTYKYLNGGPGSPAFLYIQRNILKSLHNPISGWFGHSNPFLFSEKFKPSIGIKKFLNGTPSIISVVAMEAGIDITIEAGTKFIENKSKQQSEMLKKLIIKHLIPYGFKLESPIEVKNRGSHISISHSESWRICKALQKEKPLIITDYRPPRFIRIGISPLYIRYIDIVNTVIRLVEIVKNKKYLNFTHQKTIVS
ncbi:MAG: kynureninase [Flavobacteriaceae bacterium]|nr:kynureninase [Flavobacteriaceae bacterium]|tara:strand:+ start:25658 stop:26917 length:1260 start_codon:yes stop_codon:yes gene_type:complete